MNSIRDEVVALDTNVFMFALRKEVNYPACETLLFDKLNELQVYVPLQILIELQHNLTASEMRSALRALARAKTVTWDYVPAPVERIRQWEQRGTMIENKINRYWKQFLQSLPLGAERPETCYTAFSFGRTKEGATEIAALVLAGIKTSTGSLQWVYEAEGKPLPQPGDLSIVTDGNNHPLCVIETTEVRILPFNEVDEQFAYEGGEEDRTLASWRKMYWSYIVSECVRIHREPTETTPLVCERFRVVYKEPFREEL